VRNPREAGTGFGFLESTKRATGFAVRRDSEVHAELRVQARCLRQARERRSREAGFTAAKGRASEGRTPRGHGCPAFGSAPASRREQPSEAVSVGGARRETAREEGGRRRLSISGRPEALKAKAQERCRGETDPARSRGWPIAARSAEGVETPRAGSGGTWQPRRGGTSRLQALKSSERSGGLPNGRPG
jgi:hypothetical protein